jgi:hypothetical protein
MYWGIFDIPLLLILTGYGRSIPGLYLNDERRSPDSTAARFDGAVPIRQPRSIAQNEGDLVDHTPRPVFSRLD